MRCALAPASSGNTTASESFLFCVSRTKQSDSLSALRPSRCGLKGSKRTTTLVVFLKCLLWSVSLPFSRRRCLRHLGSLTGTLWCVKLLFVSHLSEDNAAASRHHFAKERANNTKSDYDSTNNRFFPRKCYSASYRALSSLSSPKQSVTFTSKRHRRVRSVLPQNS